jgi:hypothetical protein
VVTRRWTRTLSAGVWSEGTEKALINGRPHDSRADSMSLLVGGAFGIGAGRRRDGRPGSEYGAVPDTIDGGITVYF